MFNTSMEGLENDIDNNVPDATGPNGPDAVSVDETPEMQITRLQQEAGGLRDQSVRQAAEFQNYRRRTSKEKDQMMDYGKLLVVQQILDVIDDFRRSLDAAEQVGDKPDLETLPDAFRSLHTGVAMVYGKLLGELAKLGVEQINAVGKPFDEAEHEALMSQPVGEGEQSDQVVSEIQTGYKMGDRVIRHARVVVTA
ncbi:MAG: molecular chaperone GrpE [Rhodothermales bacterium]